MNRVKVVRGFLRLMRGLKGFSSSSVGCQVQWSTIGEFLGSSRSHSGRQKTLANVAVAKAVGLKG